jgi:hypothetical protein
MPLTPVDREARLRSASRRRPGGARRSLRRPVSQEHLPNCTVEIVPRAKHMRGAEWPYSSRWYVNTWRRTAVRGGRPDGARFPLRKSGARGPVAADDPRRRPRPSARARGVSYDFERPSVPILSAADRPGRGLGRYPRSARSDLAENIGPRIERIKGVGRSHGLLNWSTSGATASSMRQRLAAGRAQLDELEIVTGR